MVDVSTSLGAQTALQTQRPGGDQADVARVQHTNRSDQASGTNQTDVPSAAFQLSENAQGVVTTGSESAQTERDSQRRRVAVQTTAQLTQFFTDLYHRDFGYPHPEAQRKATRIVGKARSAIEEAAANITARVARSNISPDHVIHLVHVDVMKLKSDTPLQPNDKNAPPHGDAPPPPPPPGPPPVSGHGVVDTAPPPPPPPPPQALSRLRDTRVTLTLEARHQSGTPSFTEPIAINLLDHNGAHGHEPLIDLSSGNWQKNVSSAQQADTLNLHLDRTVPLPLDRQNPPSAHASQGGGAETLPPHAASHSAIDNLDLNA